MFISIIKPQTFGIELRFICKMLGFSKCWRAQQRVSETGLVNEYGHELSLNCLYILRFESTLYVS